MGLRFVVWLVVVMVRLLFGWVCKLVLRPAFRVLLRVNLSVGSFLDLVGLGFWIICGFWFCFGNLRCGGIW